MTGEDRFERGASLRRAVLGDEYVDSRKPAAGAVIDIERLITEYCWGEVWSRATLSKRERSLITIAMLMALNRQRELGVHTIGALRNGLVVDEIHEVILQAMIYCGIPSGLDALATVNEQVQREP